MAVRALTRIFDCILASLPDMGNKRPCAKDIAATVEDNLNRQPWPIRAFVIQAAILLAGHSVDQNTLQARLAKWRRSPRPWRSMPMRFFDAMAAIHGLSEAKLTPSRTPIRARLPARSWPQQVEVAVVGSGPGGAVTAATLAKAGHHVLLLEEGDRVREGTGLMTRPEMLSYLRHGGATPTIGNAGTALFEGRCLGGASEINSGLYVRPSQAILTEWGDRFGVALGANELKPHYQIIENALGLNPNAVNPSQAAERLRRGAEAMEWQTTDALKMIRTDQQGEFSDTSNTISATMSRTFLEEAMVDGAHIETGASVKRLRHNGRHWNLDVSGGGATRERNVVAQTVFLAAGAIQTPRLLRRSGLTRMAGRQLCLQPVAEIVAEFSEPVNSHDMGMPPTQVHTFAPDMLLGIGISAPARLAIALASYPDAQLQLTERWRYMAVYTVLLGRSCPARILFPGWSNSLVYHSLSGADWRTLGMGLKRLSQLLFKAGARQLYPVGDRALAVGPDDRCDALTNLPRTFKPRLTSVHLTSSCPMGDRGIANICNSYGQVHGMPGLHIADASMLCTSPATNPQAIIMAIAHRNACHFAGRMVQLDGGNTGQNRLSSETLQ